MGVFSALASVFSTGEDILDYSNIELSEEQRKSLESVEKKENEVKKGFNSSKSGFKTKINPKTEEAMRAMHSKVAKKENKDREIGE